AVDLPAPLSDGNDLLRALRPRLERTTLPAPATGLRLSIPQIARARRVQLDLSRDRAGSPDNLPALLAELSPEIGKERDRALAGVDAHRPEARSELVHVDLESTARPSPSTARSSEMRRDEPMLLLSPPIPIGTLAKGAVVAVGGCLYAVEA